MNQSKKITEGALLTSIYIILLLITAFVPAASIITTFVLAVPFVIYAAKHGLKPSLLMFLVAVGLSVIFATVFSLPITVLMGTGGIVVGISIHNKLTAYETWARGTIGFVAGILFVFVFSQLVFQVNIMDEMEEMINQSVQMSKDLVEQVGLEGQAEDQMELLEEQLGLLTNLVPAGIAFSAILLAFINQWISYKVINRLEKRQFNFPPFRTLRLPVSLIWIYFFSLIITFFELDPAGTLYLAVNNVLIVVGMLMILQGFSFIFFYAHHKKMSKALPIVCVVVTLLFPFILLYLVLLLGIIDVGFSLRDRLSSNSKK